MQDRRQAAAVRVAIGRRHFPGSPAAIQDARTSRSCGVISVMLPGGIACERTATISIKRACRRICSSLSSITPFGATGIPAQTGSAAWHMLQRERTIFDTCLNFGVGGKAPVVTARGPAADSHAIAAIPAAATAHVHHGLPLPSWRELKKWRMTGPTRSTMAAITQLYLVADISG